MALIVRGFWYHFVDLFRCKFSRAPTCYQYYARARKWWNTKTKWNKSQTSYIFGEIVFQGWNWIWKGVKCVVQWGSYGLKQGNPLQNLTNQMTMEAERLSLIRIKTCQPMGKRPQTGEYLVKQFKIDESGTIIVDFDKETNVSSNGAVTAINREITCFLGRVWTTYIQKSNQI